MAIVGINVWAVLVAALVMMVLGGLWYSPILFGKRWMKLSGLTEKSMKSMRFTPTQGYIIGFVSAIITSVVLALVVGFAGAISFLDGVLVGALVWLGFVATTQFSGFLWENKPVELFFLNTLYSVVSFVIAGGILAVWV